MPSQESKSYSMMSVRHWLTLRDKFKEKIPSTTDKNYLASLLNMSATSAQSNVMPTLKMAGLVLADDKTNLELAKRWRDDEQYASVCDELLKALYPEQLLDLFSSKDNQKDVVRWFMNDTGNGAPACNRLAAFYNMLQTRTPSDRPPLIGTRKAQPQKDTRTYKNSNVKSTGKEHEISVESIKHDRTNNVPSLHIDVQIHISSDASAEQIDHIFSSMAKHLKIGASE